MPQAFGFEGINKSDHGLMKLPAFERFGLIWVQPAPTDRMVDIDAWLRGPLREWMTDMLSERRLQQDGFFQAKPITELVAQHRSGNADWGAYLWSALMFQVWLHRTGPTL